MCVIIEREPGKVIPAKQLDLACEIDNHGYGLVYHDGKELKVFRSIKANDPKEVGERLQKLKDYKVWLHLRHATVGAVNLENSHPFILGTKKKIGIDLLMMHNGTLYEYKPTDTTSTESDTLQFVKRFAIPLAMRFAAFDGKKLLDDQFYSYLMKKEAGYVSILLLIDGAGNVLKINGDKGKDYDWGWASNDHLTDTQHMRSKSRTTYYGGSKNWWEEDDGLPWEARVTETKLGGEILNDWEQDLRVADEAKEKVATVFESSDSIRVSYECVKIAEVVNMTNTGSKTIMQPLTKLKKSFKELAGIPDLKKVGNLTEDDLIEVSKNFPAGMARLVIDLLDEIRTLTHRNDLQSKTILELTPNKLL